MSERASRRRRAAAYLGQPYVRQIEKAKAAGAIPLRPGLVHHVEVRHDDDCPKLAGGLCDCRPDLELVTRPEASA